MGFACAMMNPVWYMFTTMPFPPVATTLTEKTPELV
jgi:hypothetical protein